MDWLHEKEIHLILALQQFSPALDRLAMAVTFLGDEPFFLLVLPMVYWCIDRQTGARLAVALVFSGWLNGVLKQAFELPRPSGVDPRVAEFRTAGGSGLPSGHAQNSVVFWGVLAAAFRKPALWVVFAAVLVLVPLSRVYLGVHFPSDVIAGLAVGGALLAACLYVAPRIEERLAAATTGTRMALAVTAPVLLIFLAGDSMSANRAAAALLGLAVGFVIERRWIRFTPAGAGIPRRALAWLFGVAVLFWLWLGLVPVLGGFFEPADAAVVRYIVLGFWVAAGAPAVFSALGLYRPRFN